MPLSCLHPSGPRRIGAERDAKGRVQRCASKSHFIVTRMEALVFYSINSVLGRRQARSLCEKRLISSFLLFSICWQIAICPMKMRGQEPVPEYTAKAGFLVLLPDYVKWPNSAEGPISVGILGSDPFGAALEKLKPKRSKRIDDLKGCQIIFISKSEQARIPAILASLEGLNILTVGETEGFAKEGGGIGFVIEGDKVRFEINPSAARRSGLGFDLRLLRLAVRVVNSQ
jgi:hypothetical protein